MINRVPTRRTEDTRWTFRDHQGFPVILFAFVITEKTPTTTKIALMAAESLNLCYIRPIQQSMAKSTRQDAVAQNHTCRARVRLDCLLPSPPCCHHQHLCQTGRNTPGTLVTLSTMAKDRWCSRRCLPRGCPRLRCQQPVYNLEFGVV